jgi:hypothetical protein
VSGLLSFPIFKKVRVETLAYKLAIPSDVFIQPYPEHLWLEEWRLLGCYAVWLL